MNEFDAVIIGAGPAGCHCARLLAKLGTKVLLVEQHDDFYKNDFSSAGTPLETLKQFDLPLDVIGSYWNKIIIVTTNIHRTWESQKNLGVVLNFAKLRQFLSDEVKLNGGEVWLGYRYVRHEREESKTLVTLKPTGKPDITISTKVLVDATGPARAVMYEKESDKPDFIKGTGIEYLIEVEEKDYNKYADSISFFLGHKWMPKGYSWIFPMENNRLKVGAGCLKLDHQVVEDVKPLRTYIELLIDEYIKTNNYQIIDIHGSTLKYSLGLNDIYYKDNIIAIGDAVSTVNFLGGEGIRHGMYSAEVASQYIQQYLEGENLSFKRYQTEIKKHFSIQWSLSETIGMKKYLIDSDDKIDKIVAYISPLKAEDLIDVLFYYKFEKLSRGLGKYLFQKIRFWWQGVGEYLGLK